MYIVTVPTTRDWERLVSPLARLRLLYLREYVPALVTV